MEYVYPVEDLRTQIVLKIAKNYRVIALLCT